MYDVDGDINEIDPEDISSKGKESMYDYIGKELGIEYSEATENVLKGRVFQLRQRLKELFSKPRFKEIMGIEDWSEKNLDILKGKDYEQEKEFEKLYKTGSGVAYIVTGKQIGRASCRERV